MEHDDHHGGYTQKERKNDMHGIKQKHIAIYKRYPPQYDLFMSKQDHNNALIPEILNVFSLNSKHITSETLLELGSGTGRLTLALAKHFQKAFGLDSSSQMVEYASIKCRSHFIQNCEFLVGDYRYIPFQSDCVSLVVAGWTLSYLKVNYPYTEPDVESDIRAHDGIAHKEPSNEHQQENVQQGWAFHLRHTLSECKRVLKTGGMLLILESRGVGYDQPTREGSWYYKYLTLLGFHSSIVRTDYLFESPYPQSQEREIYIT